MAYDLKTLLGGLSAQAFMREHWQKQLRFIPQAVPGFTDLLTPEAMWRLAASGDVESRLVIRDGKRWVMEHGPFARGQRAQLPARNWTLLVQGLNLHVPAADDWLRRFSFLPYARLDDVMVSLAAPGGGVGPHFDSYDVFLMQGMGKRRWRMSMQTDLALLPDAPLKILKRMRTDQTVDAVAGDLLYLPPQVAHDGVAMQSESEGFCTTYSVGFRAPTRQEIADGFLDWIGATSEIDGRLGDPDLKASSHPARIPASYQREIAGAIAELAIGRDTIREFAGCFASEPKPHVAFDPPATKLARAAFVRECSRESSVVAFAAGTLCLYDDTFLFINGDAFIIRGDDAFWREFADARRFRPSTALPSLGEETVDALYQWYCDGWLHVIHDHAVGQAS
ncbi:MAG: cupin domain-containing protein [Burkholderiales bacterium]|nr:cupin domain-containing protein [Burkholderiales bacterium]